MLLPSCGGRMSYVIKDCKVCVYGNEQNCLFKIIFYIGNSAALSVQISFNCKWEFKMNSDNFSDNHEQLYYNCALIIYFV